MPRYSAAVLPLTILTKDDAPSSHPNGLLAPAFAAIRRIRDYWSDPQHLVVYDESVSVDLVRDASAAIVIAGARLRF